MDYSIDTVKVKVKSNFYRVKLGQLINRYELKIICKGEIIDPNENFELLLKIVSLLRKDFIAIYGSQHYRASNMIYSALAVGEQKFNNIIEGKPIIVTIEPMGVLQVSDKGEASNFYGRILKVMQGKLKLKQVNRKYFDEKQVVRFSEFKLELWQGYSTSFQIYKGQPVVNIDLSYRVISEQTVSELFRISKSRGDGKLKDIVVGLHVMALHTKIHFRIDDIDYGKTPADSFTLENGSTITFLQYFKEKYNLELKEKDWPMLVQRRTKNGKEMINYFPPELCIVTGLSAEMRVNGNLMKNLAKTTQLHPGVRLNRCNQLIKKLNNNPDVKETMKEWDIRIEEEPITISAKRINAGNMLMGTSETPMGMEEKEMRYAIKVDDNDNLNHDTQCKMLEQPPLDNWVVFYHQQDKRALGKFLDNMKIATKSHGCKAKGPTLIELESKDAKDWIYQIDQNTNTNTCMAVFLLYGRKNASPLYNPIKTHLIVERPIPSQMISTSTINSDKDLRPICSKILVQMCAKMGGIPWNISDLPFDDKDKPIMIIGVDVFHKTKYKEKSLLAFTATMNRGCSKYWCTVRQQEVGQEVSSNMESAFTDAIKVFCKVNNRPPVRIVVYRDGVSESQRQTVQTLEVHSIRRAIETFVGEKVFVERPDFIFICANKNINAKFYAEHPLDPQGLLNNPKSGTVIDSEITEDNDFYLISQTTKEGSITPTHYFVLGYYTEVDGEYRDRKDTLKKMMFEIQILTYKLCYLYYNWVGPIKIPAPIKYADRLAKLIGDRWQNGNSMIPHPRFGNAKSLFFL